MRAAFLPLILVLLSAMPSPAAEGPFKRIRARIAEVIDPRDPASPAGAIGQGTMAYCLRHGKLPASREHLVEGLECAELPTTGLDTIHNLELTSKAANRLIITGNYKKGGMEVPLRVNLEVSVDKQGLKTFAKLSAKQPLKKGGAKP